jgi:hypothetical protein
MAAGEIQDFGAFMEFGPAIARNIPQSNGA